MASAEDQGLQDPDGTNSFWIDTLPMNKTDVMPYLNGSVTTPPKYARAIIFEGGKEFPDSQEYMIGPLPVTEKTSIQKLDYLYNGGSGSSVPFNSRYFDGPRTTATDPLVASIMSNISDITAALFQGGVYFGANDKRSMSLYWSLEIYIDFCSNFVINFGYTKQL